MEPVETVKPVEAMETVDTVETVENAYFPTLCPSYMQTPSYYILQLLAEYFQYKYIKSTSIYIPELMAVYPYIQPCAHILWASI